MFQVKNYCKLNHQNVETLIISSQMLSRQQLRHQTNVAAKGTNSNATSEWDRARPFEEIPTDTAFNTIRSFLPGGRYYKSDSNQLLMGYKRDYGEIFLMPSIMGKPPILFTYSPNDFERVFRNEGIWPIRPGSDTIHHHRNKLRADFYQGTEGIIATQGATWGKFRSAVNPVLMQPKNIKFYLNKMSQVNLEFIERIKAIRDPKTLEVPDNFEEEINRWTLESVSVVALDKKLGLLTENRNNPKVKQLFANLTEMFYLSFELDFKPSPWQYIPTPKYKRLMKALDGIQEIALSYVNEALERLENDTINDDQPENEKSILEKLLNIDKRIATVMAMDLIMAGVDTTSSTFAGILLCLAKNPEKQNKLRDEILRILPNKNSDFDENSLQNIPYLRACIKEGLRMYPLVVGNARVPQKDVVLSGYRVPKGTLVSMISTSLLRDENYFPHANEFLPERWLRSNNATTNPLKAGSSFVFLPFGFGPRSCIGKRIVDLELELGLARLIRNFDIEFNYSTEKPFKNLLINVPNIPLKFKFTDV